MSPAYLILATFLACAVEAVEALTIVLAVGTTRGWRSTLYGVGAAGLVLAAVTAILGPAFSSIPIDSLRILVGTLLILFGLQWLYKAVLRAAGLKAQRNEATAYARESHDTWPPPARRPGNLTRSAPNGISGTPVTRDRRLRGAHGGRLDRRRPGRGCRPGRAGG